MLILNDSEIGALCHGASPMIDPFVGRQVRTIGDAGDVIKVMSFGLSSFGYDIRLGNEFKIFHNVDRKLIDVKNFDEKTTMSVTADYVDIPPNTTVLGHSLETICMPDDVMAIRLGKSSYARAGIHLLATPLEPGWRGTITLGISNLTSCYNRAYAGEGISQLIFFKGNRPESTYSDRGGRYQDQEGVTTPRA